MLNRFEYATVYLGSLPFPEYRVSQGAPTAERRGIKLLRSGRVRDAWLERREVGWWVEVARRLDDDTWEVLDEDAPWGAHEYVVRYRRERGSQHATYFENQYMATDFIDGKLLAAPRLKRQRRRIAQHPRPLRWPNLTPIIDLRVERRPVGPWEPFY
jgi:hypothetical protein